MAEYEKIVTHNDFDGVVSAAIVSKALGTDRFVFAGPRTIAESRITITKNDVVCDLPYPLECGFWFDHHEGNLEELKYRGIDPASIPGRFALRDSCARVVYEYFQPQVELPEFFAATVDEADVLDSFKFSSVEDWRRETPGKVVDGAIKAQQGKPRERDAFLRELVRLLRETPLSEVAERPDIRQAYERYRELEEEMLRVIERDASFLPQDKNKELIVLDLTAHRFPPRLVKKLAFLLYPEAKAVLEIKNIFRNGVKSTDLSVSMSLGISLSNVEHSKDVGEIMRELNIGDGHRGAGAGTVFCSSKAEMLKEKDRLLKEIYEIWSKQ